VNIEPTEPLKFAADEFTKLGVSAEEAAAGLEQLGSIRPEISPAERARRRHLGKVARKARRLNRRR